MTRYSLPAVAPAIWVNWGLWSLGGAMLLVMTTLVAAVLLGERLNLNQYLGGGMVLTALIASSLIGLRRATRP